MAKKRSPVPTFAADPHHFDFDLDRGIRTQVVEKLEASPLLPLTRGGPALSGIYALYFKGKLVYIGKASKGTTKSKRTLRSRLSEHVTKIATRQNITMAQMKCRYLTFSSEWWVFRGGVCPNDALPTRMERERVWQQGAWSGSSGNVSR